MDSCRDCHAWGVTRLHDWRCGPCNHWRRAYPTIAECRTCGRARSLGRHGVCRLCHVQAQRLRRPDGEFDPYFANRHGQQLFFALRVGRATVMADAAGSAVSNAVSAPLPSSESGPGLSPAHPVHSRPDLSILGRAGLHLPRPQRTSRQARSPCERHRRPPRLEQEDDQRCVHRCAHRARHPRRSQWPDQRQRRRAVARDRSGRALGAHRVRRGRRAHRRSDPGSGPVGSPADRDASRAHAKRGPEVVRRDEERRHHSAATSSPERQHRPAPVALVAAGSPSMGGQRAYLLAGDHQDNGARRCCPPRATHARPPVRASSRSSACSRLATSSSPTPWLG